MSLRKDTDDYSLGKSASARVSARVNALLEKLGHDRAWLARETGIQPPHVSDLLNCKKRNWRGSRLADVAAALGVTVLDIYPEAPAGGAATAGAKAYTVDEFVALEGDTEFSKNDLEAIDVIRAKWDACGGTPLTRETWRCVLGLLRDERLKARLRAAPK